MLALALPVVLGYLGLMTMTMVDLFFVGRVGPAAIGAVGVGTFIFSWGFIFGIGILTGLDYLISHSFGAKRVDECGIWFSQGLWLSFALGVPLNFLMIAFSYKLDWIGVNPEMGAQGSQYLRVLACSVIPSFVFTAGRIYLQAFGIAKPATLIMFVANLINILANYAFVFGHWGFPRMEAVGAGWATLVSRIWMAFAILAYAYGWDRKAGRSTDWIRIQRANAYLKRLVRLSLPAALQMTFEVGVFAFTTALVSRLSTIDMAAHQIVLNIASLTFMVPLGIGSATAVLVGQALGAGEPKRSVQMGWKGFLLGVGFMACSCVALLSIPRAFISAYTHDLSVIDLGSSILMIAALFQLFDGAQTVATGALRGLGDTRSSAIANLAGHWLFGLPLGVYLCFKLDWGIRGLWIGLSAGLVAVALSLTLRWMYLTKSVVAQARSSLLPQA